MTRSNLLIFTDSPQLAPLVMDAVARNGANCTTHPLFQGTDMLPCDHHLILVDASEKMELGLDACRILRTHFAGPILMLISSQNEKDLLSAYTAGADECISRSISPKLLAAKIIAWLRWSHLPLGDEHSIHQIESKNLTVHSR